MGTKGYFVTDDSFDTLFQQVVATLERISPVFSMERMRT